MKILVTGYKGFVGRNLLVKIKEIPDFEALCFGSGDSPQLLEDLIAEADAVIHLAGVNRPENPSDFSINYTLTENLINGLIKYQKKIPILFSSSIKVESGSPYGLSKLKAEDLLKKFCLNSGSPVIIFRLPGVFGKWAKPNYNSVVATFCSNIAKGIPIDINKNDPEISLVFIDDVIDLFLKNIVKLNFGLSYIDVHPIYRTTIKNLAYIISSFDSERSRCYVPDVAGDFEKTLYSTYVSYLPCDKFSYDIDIHRDTRGVFAELYKTQNSGQISYFTAPPGITRGGHYHHAKVEKFVVLSGVARFRFKSLNTNEFFEIIADALNPKVVETIPGWVHDVTNIGLENLVVVIWANEVFNKLKTDTFVEEL